jgi:hypothetical protein
MVSVLPGLSHFYEPVVVIIVLLSSTKDLDFHRGPLDAPGLKAKISTTQFQKEGRKAAGATASGCCSLQASEAKKKKNNLTASTPSRTPPGK